MVKVEEFDELDRRIIRFLSMSSQGSYRQIAKQLGVHPTTLIQRVKNLESKGVIKGYRAKVDYMNLGYEYMGIVHIYSEDVVEVQRELKEISQVMAIYDVTGDADCIVTISCRDREEFSSTVKAINSLKGVLKTNTSVVLSIVKDPNDYVPDIMDV
ncbi:MAG: Lrp/AsnC family transcriptional regulator [Candidatus Methanogranum gryphiswaldense]|nr:MAG: Lrp/AsnC family transcriptional regulator [Candidatus Methanogranum sp. U3.2.1]